MGKVADEMMGETESEEKKRKPKLLKDIVDGAMPKVDKDKQLKFDGVSQQILGDRS